MSLEKSSVRCIHGKGFNCITCWPLTERPMAARGLTSYRYPGRFGFIMIGGKDHADAMREAGRSTDLPITLDKLEVWNGSGYVKADDTATHEPTTGLQNSFIATTRCNN